MEILESKPKNYIDLKEDFEKQGLEIVNIKFIDDETSIFITRKKKN